MSVMRRRAWTKTIMLPKSEKLFSVKTGLKRNGAWQNILMQERLRKKYIRLPRQWKCITENCLELQNVCSQKTWMRRNLTILKNTASDNFRTAGVRALNSAKYQPRTAIYMSISGSIQIHIISKPRKN